jgi:hypothetical protein
VAAPFVQFAENVLKYHRTGELKTQHILSNHSCEIDGNVAHTETYCHCFSVPPPGCNRLSSGRFVDRLEKRSGKWAIVSCASLPEGPIEAPAFDDRIGMVELPGHLAIPRDTRVTRPTCGHCR